MSLGVSAAGRAPTPATHTGPWFIPDPPETDTLWRPGIAGQRLLIRGAVFGTDGKPVAGASLRPYDLDAGWAAQRGTPIQFQTDAQGRARLTLGRHRYGLLVIGPGPLRAGVEVDLRTPSSESIEIRLPRLASVAFRSGDVPHPMGIRLEDAKGRTVGARRFLPMHWGTFQLTDEPLAEPAERVRAWWQADAPADKEMHLLAVGETLCF